MKTLLVVTFVDFWVKGSGHRSRISSLIGFLQDRVLITVFFAGVITDDDRKVLEKDFPTIRLEGASKAEVITYGDFTERFKRFISEKSFDFVLVEYIELSSILEFLPERTITLLDTHDLVADRTNSFKKLGLAYDGIELTRDEELSIFGCYDYVVLIQQNDLESVARSMERNRLLLAPHPVRARKRRIRKKVRNIGFVASPYLPNIEALEWFLNHVWKPIRQKHELTLNIYGNIQQAFPPRVLSNVFFHGFVADVGEAYRDSDIIINPVRCGAGLKIKNVEALGHGLPLVTTTHGASGMEGGAAGCFLKADAPGEFGAAISLLIEDHALRKELAKNAFDYARAHFSEERCYEGIVKLIT